MLRPASGFQSTQFKSIEARLGVKFDQRHGQNYYTSQLKQADVDTIKTIEESATVLQLVNNWLERLPFFKDENYWKNFAASPSADVADPVSNNHPFWKDYENIYAAGLADAEKINLEHFRRIFLTPHKILKDR